MQYITFTILAMVAFILSIVGAIFCVIYGVGFQQKAVGLAACVMLAGLTFTFFYSDLKRLK
jgi:hypothetical protein